MLQNKTIVIIGGTAGLGLAAAEACVKSGAKVVVVGRRQENIDAAQNSLGDAGYALQGDATDSTTGYKAIEVAIHKFGSFDGLYHVAGGSGRRMGDGPLHEITDEGWEFTLNLNLTSAFYSNRAAVQQFQIQGNGGSILNMGSVLGSSPSPKYFATHAYAATKAAIEGFTKSCAAYYAKDNIRFNVLAPALFETPMAQRAAENEEIMSFISTKQPLDGGRIGQPEDTAQAAVYFLSGASKFVTGQVLYVDGGWSVSEGQYPPPS
ncbi:MAG: SDR family oxidoreductase [Planctomycetota bacterium]|nr:SDR family oxidoreductase [Planctomycetota bacterium]